MITPYQGPISSGEIASCAITTAKINDSAVTTAKINTCAVTTAKINDSGVTAAKIGNCAVTEAKINDSAVTANKIGNCAVTTAKINTCAVTTAKINDSGVTAAKIGTSAVVSGKIAASAITAVKLRASSLDYIVYKGRASDVTLSASGLCSLATPGFTPHGVIAVPLCHTSIVFMGLKALPTTSLATLAFRTASATGSLMATSNTITFYYEYRRP